MEKIDADPTMENENTEHIRGKRLSSILKASRLPLDDLGNGNELTQDITIEKRRKTLRRVSFANTINCRVFERDLKSNTAESTECSADTRNDVLLHQNEDPEAVPCEITGMNTLLHAPIQAPVQQTEGQDADSTLHRLNRHDSTVLFSEENEMDMTSSHTAVITGNLISSQDDQTRKIDFTSFLASLNSSNANSETSKEFPSFPDPTEILCPAVEQKEDATAVKKINLNEFLMSLTSTDKAANSGPEEEDVFCIPSQASEDITQSSAVFVYSHEPMDTCNVTKVFRGQEDGMEMTKCLSVDAKAVFSAVGEAPAQCGDVTEAFVDDGMDMTISHTARMSFPFSTAGNQSLNFQKDFPATELDNSILKRASNQHLTVQHNPQLCTDKNPVSVEGRREPAGLRAVKQEARTMSAIPGSVSSETVFRGDQTLPSSKGDDMDITGNYTDVIHNDSTKEMKSSHHKTCEKPVNANSLLAGSRPPTHGDRDSTRSLSSSDNRAPESHKTRALELSLSSEEQIQRVTQDHSTTSASADFDPCTASASAGVSQSRLQHRLNPQLASVPSEKTVLFSGEDMDLTKTSAIKNDGKNDESESPAGVFTSATCKPHFLRNRATSSNLNEQEEMVTTKCHAVVIDNHHNRITVEAKQMPCETIPRKNQKKDISEYANSLDKDKENIEVIGINGNVKRSQAIEVSAKDIEVKMVDKRLGKTNFQASGPSSCAKGFCSLQEQRQEVPGNRVTDTSAFVPLQSQKAVKSQPLEKNFLNASVSCTNDKVFSDDQNMDITETLPAAFDADPLNTVQECKNNHHQSNVMFRQLQTQSVAVTSQTVAIECGDWRMKTNKPSVTPWAPNGSCVSSNEMGMKGNTQPGTTSGINTGCQNSDRQEKTHVMKVVNKTLPAPERGFLIGETTSSEEAFKAPHSADGLSLLGANLPEAHKFGSQLPLALEKSVVFPSGESMDLTGNCVVSDYRVNVPLSERKAVPGYQDENKTTSLKRGVRVTVKSQEQPVHDVYSFGKKMIPFSGLKPLPCTGEKTTLFSEDADMDITRSHTVSADHKITLQHKSANDDTALISGDKTCVYNDDMEISKLNTVAIDKPEEKAVSQGMLITAKRIGRKSLKGVTGEKTVLFSLSNENNDMEITESHTAAIGHEIVSQNKGGLSSVSSADPFNTVLFSSSQADMDITKSYSAVCDEELASEKEAGQQALPNSKAATRFAVENRDITKTHHITLEGNSLRGWRPSTSTVMFTSFQADMEMTQCHSGGEGIGRVFCEERLKQVGQEAVSTTRTIVFPSAEDMEITRAHTAVLTGAIGVQDTESVPAIPAVPAHKTVVFSHNRDDMEITASHTTALNDVKGFGKEEWSCKSTQQPDLVLPSWRGEIDSSHTKDLNGEYQTNFEPKASIPFASSASAFPGEKGAIQVPSVVTPEPVYSASIPEETVRTPQDLDIPTDDSVPVSSQQDLLPPENLSSQRASSKLLSNGPRDPSEEGGNLVSQVSLLIQQADPLSGSPDAHSTQRNQVLKGESARPEDLATDLGLTGASLAPVSNKESKENQVLSAEGGTPPEDLQIISGQTKQLSVSDKQRDQVDPTLAPEISGISNVWSKLQNIRRKSAVFSVSEPVFSDQLPTSSVQPEGTLRLGKDTIKEAEQEKTCLESGAAPVDATVGMALENKFQGIRVPLGIFQPKLPSRRNPSVASVQDINTKSSEKGEAPVSQEGVNAGETPGTSKFARQHFSPSQFIAEEFLPVCLEEMDSNESVSSELMENVYSEGSKKETTHNEMNQLEKTKTCSNTKRALEQDEEALQSPKKVKGDENFDGDASQDLQVTSGTVSGSQVEVHEGEDPPNLLAKSPDYTHASTSSSLDSGKADTELTIQRSSHMESWLLTDSICEDTLREKLESGAITVGEFLTLLQVHVPIQKPRYSQIPTSCAVSAAPTAADLLYSQYVYRPKLRIYEEDCKALSQKIDELKEYVDSVQDQLLVNVNKSLWEVMRSCSDEELKSFGAELNKMKSCFTMESKILAHNEKAALYSKLLQSVQEQQEKLQSRTEKVDEVLKEAESCLAALEADAGWYGCEAGCSGEMAGGKSLERELASIKAQEEELQRELLALEIKNEQMLTRMSQLKEEEKYYQELLEKCSFAEWDMTEWSEKQAVFSFLYESVELTVVFGPPIDGDEFGEDPSRMIVSLNFESLLDEEAAPPSSCLVLKLIFQFIESQGCWQEKYPTLYHLPQVLHNLSSVVSHCKTLGEEIEFLERWGGKFSLLETELSDTRVKLLFSSSVAFAKFELTLSLSANYPSAPLPFTVHRRIGNIGEEEVSAVLSKVPVGHHYLRRIVSSIHQCLLQAPR